jgi:hypothetical protein
MQLSKLEAARRQLETAIKLYFEYGDECSPSAQGGQIEVIEEERVVGSS